MIDGQITSNNKSSLYHRRLCTVENCHFDKNRLPLFVAATLHIVLFQITNFYGISAWFFHLNIVNLKIQRKIIV